MENELENELDNKDDNNVDKQYIKMTETKISKLITSLAVPTIISMLVTSIYNMADTYFVSKLGTSASGAVGIVFSLMAIIQAIGFTLGMGSGSLISRLLGAKREEKANEVGSTGFFLAILVGVLLAVFGLIFIDPLMKLLGSTNTILPYAKDYAGYILFGAPIMMASFVMNNILRSEGKANLAMIGIGTGGILNIILDPIFIFTFGLGISGAAIATILSQLISFFILLSHFISKRSEIKLHIRNFTREFETCSMIIKTGLPSLARQGLASIATVMLNVAAAGYGDAAVAAMSIVGKIFMFIYSIMIGFGQGYQPVLGFNYGAKKYDRVKEAFTFTLKTGMIIMTIFAVFAFIFAPQFIKAFIADDIDVIKIGTEAFRFQCAIIPLVPLGVIANMTFQSIGKSFTATILSSLRQGIFFIPLILVLPNIFGVVGVEMTQTVSDLCTFFVCLPFMINFFKDIGNKEMEI